MLSSANFKQYTPAEVKALSERLDAANKVLEGQRGGIEHRKRKLVKSFKEQGEALAAALPEGSPWKYLWVLPLRLFLKLKTFLN